MKFDFMYTGQFTPSELEDIGKCIKNLTNIPAGAVPLARGMGISWAGLSQVPEDLQNDYATELIEKIEEYEPRVTVREVTFSCDSQGQATVHAVLEKEDDNE